MSSRYGRGGAATGRIIGHERAKLVLVPYYAWANRQPGEMAVWLRRGRAD